MNNELSRVLRGPDEGEVSKCPIFWFLLKTTNPSETASKLRQVIGHFSQGTTNRRALGAVNEASTPEVVS